MTIKNAILSVSDKSGIVELANELTSVGVNLYSTGGTKKVLLKNNISVNDISSLTDFKEILDGRVKTLHPHVHAGILAKKNNQKHQETLNELNISKIDLVVVNLYPFEKTIEKDSPLDEIIENIDIGGPTLLRSSAKNYQSVVVVSHPKYYDELTKKLKDKNLDLPFREKLATAAFKCTRNYDTAIEKFFSKNFLNQEGETFHYKKKKDLRYGENPHQKSSLFYQEKETYNFSLADAKILHGKEMSYNNYLDSEAAILSAFKYKKNTASIVKHSNPCGYANGENIYEALKMAWQGDIVSAFGSVIAINGKLTAEASEFLKDKFIEIILIKEYEEKALEQLKKKSKNLRIIQIFEKKSQENNNYRMLNGVLLKQSINDGCYNYFKKVTKSTSPIVSEGLYEFAYQSVKNIKSNAISICYEYEKNKYMLMGMGADSQIE